MSTIVNNINEELEVAVLTHRGFSIRVRSIYEFSSIQHFGVRPLTFFEKV